MFASCEEQVVPPVQLLYTSATYLKAEKKTEN